MQTVLLGIQLVICMFLIGLSWFMQNQQKALESQMAGGRPLGGDGAYLCL